MGLIFVTIMYLFIQDVSLGFFALYNVKNRTKFYLEFLSFIFYISFTAFFLADFQYWLQGGTSIQVLLGCICPADNSVIEYESTL